MVRTGRHPSILVLVLFSFAGFCVALPRDGGERCCELVGPPPICYYAQLLSSCDNRRL